MLMWCVATALSDMVLLYAVGAVARVLPVHAQAAMRDNEARRLFLSLRYRDIELCVMFVARENQWMLLS